MPQNKRGEIGLTYIYGIGRSSANKILAEAGVDKDIKVEDWTDEQASKIRDILGAKYKVEGDLRSEVQLNIKRLMDMLNTEAQTAYAMMLLTASLADLDPSDPEVLLMILDDCRVEVNT